MDIHAGVYGRQSVGRGQALLRLSDRPGRAQDPGQAGTRTAAGHHAPVPTGGLSRCRALPVQVPVLALRRERWRDTLFAGRDRLPRALRSRHCHRRVRHRERPPGQLPRAGRADGPPLGPRSGGGPCRLSQPTVRTSVRSPRPRTRRADGPPRARTVRALLRCLMIVPRRPLVGRTRGPRCWTSFGPRSGSTWCCRARRR